MSDSAFHETLATLRTAKAAAIKKYDIAIEAVEALTNSTAPPSLPSTSGASAHLNPTKYKEAAKLVLAAVGKPIHIDQFILLFHQRGWYTEKDAQDRNFKNAVTGALHREDIDGGLFYKAAPATYGLREWQT